MNKQVTLDIPEELYDELQREFEMEQYGCKIHNPKHAWPSFEAYIVRILHDWGDFPSKVDDIEEMLEEIEDKLRSARIKFKEAYP